MYGRELLHSRKERRNELRNAAHQQLPAGTFLDAEDVLRFVDTHPTRNEGCILSRRLLPFALVRLGIPAETVREAFRIPVNAPVDLTLNELLADPAIARGIEQTVVDLVPETPEPGRGSAPVREDLQSGMVGAPDPAVTKVLPAT